MISMLRRAENDREHLKKLCGEHTHLQQIGDGNMLLKHKITHKNISYLISLRSHRMVLDFCTVHECALLNAFALQLAQ